MNYAKAYDINELSIFGVMVKNMNILRYIQITLFVVVLLFFALTFADSNFQSVSFAEENGADESFFEPIPEGYYPAQIDSKSKVAGDVLLDLSHLPYHAQFTSFITMMQGLGFNVTVASDYANLASYDILIVSVPQAFFSNADINSLISFLDSGKIVLIFGENRMVNNIQINALLYSIGAGVLIGNNMVHEPINYFDAFTFHPIIMDYTNHCLNDNVFQVGYAATSQLILENPASALSYSTPGSYLDRPPYGNGPFVITAIADPTVHPTWKLFISGDSNSFSYYQGDDFFSMFDNAQYAENIVLWCDEICITQGDCDDGLFCNGQEVCNLTTNNCESGDWPCLNDGLFCNGEESCDEASDSCLGDKPCPDDGLFCNGTEGCDETSDACTNSGDPCLENQQCNEETDKCESSDIPGTDDDDSGLWDDDDDNEDDEEELWPQGEVSGGNQSCCG